MLISSCLPIQFNHFWYHFSNVSNIFLTLLCIHCLPELHNPINQLLFRCRLYFPFDVFFKFVPQIFYWIEVWRLGGVFATSWSPSCPWTSLHALTYAYGQWPAWIYEWWEISCLEMGSTSCPEFGYIVVRSFSLRKCRFQLGLSD